MDNILGELLFTNLLRNKESILPKNKSPRIINILTIRESSLIMLGNNIYMLSVK